MTVIMFIVGILMLTGKASFIDTNIYDVLIAIIYYGIALTLIILSVFK